MSGAVIPLRFRVEAALARGALGLLRRMGPVAASNLGGAVARIVGPWLPVSRVADANLRAAMPELDAAARHRVIRGVWDNLGRTVAELADVADLKQTPSGAGWEMVGEETLGGVGARGGPVIFASGHIGNWEVLAAAAAAYGMPFSGMYRAAQNPLIDEMVMALRRRVIGTAMPMFPKGAAGARRALAHLSRGGYLGMLMDQKMNDGIEARFFGRPAMTAPALAALALRFRCPVVPSHVQRVGPARFRLVCEEPLALPDTGDRQADILAVTQAVNDRLERWIRARPEEWLWLHRRWPKEG